METKDLTGAALTARETELLEIYRRILALKGAGDLPPCAAANLEEAAVALWNAANDLMLPVEEP